MHKIEKCTKLKNAQNWKLDKIEKVDGEAEGRRICTIALKNIFLARKFKWGYLSYVCIPNFPENCISWKKYLHIRRKEDCSNYKCNYFDSTTIVLNKKNIYCESFPS